MSRYLPHVTRPYQGYSDIASVFRSTAEGETGHAHGHLEFLQEVTQPFSGVFRPVLFHADDAQLSEIDYDAVAQRCRAA